ncbi:MAG: glycosyltransferase family 4 protein [Bacteriovorax sp.]|nr:glycosyltransferase family 4 protein [Bacteriovorax sp.]
MKILLCCEHFHPSVGGVQKMMYEIGLRFINKGHDVSVVTSFRSDRNEKTIDGIKIFSFDVNGNAALGMRGDILGYQQFLINTKFDLLIVMAAQQWTFDAMLPVLDNIAYKKLHIPCGYSGFYLKKYKDYYSKMDIYLKKFDQLIYNSTNYRDVNFAREKNLKNINIIPAGASEFEFLNIKRKNVKKLLGIQSEQFVYLSVGVPAFNKGHKEILKSYLLLNVSRPSVLILNGNYDNITKLNFINLLSNPKGTLKEFVMRILGRSSYNIKKLAQKNKDSNKKIIFENFNREELISLFAEADLFLFASHIEYSPLVIFECLAAGLPFLSVPVGNVDEIVKWSAGGVICPGKKSKEGYTSVDPVVFSREIEKLTMDSVLRKELSIHGRQSWENKFTWGVIVDQIEKLVI